MVDSLLGTGSDAAASSLMLEAEAPLILCNLEGAEP